MSELQNVLGPAEGVSQSGDLIDSALETVRRHLEMDVAYLSEFVGDTIVFRAVNAPGLEHIAQPGTVMPMDQVYCGHIRDGRLPKLIQDTHDHDVATSIPMTEILPIRSHVSVPVRLEGGRVFGMFCCRGHAPKPGLNARDLAVMELFADLSARQVRSALHDRDTRSAAVSRIDAAMNGGFHMVYQPIRDLRSNSVLGFEALCRFDGVPYRSPDQWFAEAERMGRAVELELRVIEAALECVPHLPQGSYLSINASPVAVSSGTLGDLIRRSDPTRLVLEMTEHAAVGDYGQILSELAPLRAMGMRLAIDDAGAGYAGLQHILRLRPDLIKLDMSLTRDVDTDDARRSLASALVTFSRRTDARLIAEGIETPSERAALLSIGINRGQGYLLGRPVPMNDAFADTGDERKTA